MGGNIQSLKSFEKAMKSGALSAYDFAQAKKKLNATFSGAQGALNTYNAGVAASAKGAIAAASAMLKQENALERSRQKYLDLQSVLAKVKTPAGLAASGGLASAFTTLERAMTSGPQTAQNFARAQNAFNAVLNDTKRGLKENHPLLGALGLDMEDVTKATQIALGPLSGVASRLSALTSLLKGNTLAIAGFISGVTLLSVGLIAAVRAGADWEQEMNAINAVLKVTGNRMGFAAGEIDNITDSVEQATSASDNIARKATLEFLTLQNATKDLLKPALMAAQGLSLIGRGDMVSQMRRLGKVLEDPKENLKALTESGVQFNAVESEKIRVLQLSGRMHEAQVAVLNKLSTVQAAAAGQSEGLNGAWHRLTATLNNLFEESSEGTGVLSSLTGGINDVTESLKKFNEDAGAAADIGALFHGTMATIVTVVELVVHHLKLLTAVILVFMAIKVIGFINTLRKNIGKLGDSFLQAAQKAKASTKVMSVGVGLAISVMILALQRLVTSQDVAVASTSKFADEYDKSFQRIRDQNGKFVNDTGSTFGRFTDRVLNAWNVFGPSMQEQRLAKLHNLIDSRMADIATSIHDRIPKFIGVPGIDPHSVQALQNQAKKIFSALRAQAAENEKAIIEGRTPDIDVGNLGDVAKAFEVLQKDASPEAFKQFQTTVEAVAAGFTPLLDKLNKAGGMIDALPENLQAAGADFVKFRDQFAPFIKEEIDASASLENLTTNLNKMKEAMTAEGDPDSAKYIGFIIEAAENGSTAIRKLITDLTNQGSAMKRTTQINAASGQAFDKLTLEQEQMSNVMQALPNFTEDMIARFKKVPGPIKDQIDAIEAATAALHGYTHEADIASRTKAIRQQVDVSLQGLEAAGKSDAEREASAKRLAALQDLLNAGYEETDDFAKKYLNTVDAISKIDLAAQQRQLITGLQGQLLIAQRNYALAGTSAAVRDEETQALQDQVEQMTRLGHLDQEELKIKKQIRDLGRAADLAAELHAQQQQITVMQKEASLAGLSAGARAEEVAKLQDMIDLYERYGQISEQDLANRKAIRDLQKDIEHNNAMQDLQHQLDIQNKIAQTYFMTEDAQNRIVALEEEKYALTQKYGSLQDKNAQAELAAFQAVQDRVDWINRNLKPLKDAFDSLFSHIEDGMVEFLSNGKLDVIAWARSLAEDVFRIMWKNLVTEPLTNAIGGMLGKMVPNAPGVGGGLTAMGSFANPMWVKVAGGVPGVTGAGGLFGGAAANTLNLPSNGAASLAGQFQKAIEKAAPNLPAATPADPFGLGNLRGTFPMGGSAAPTTPNLPDFTSIFGGTKPAVPSLDTLMTPDQIDKLQFQQYAGGRVDNLFSGLSGGQGISANTPFMTGMPNTGSIQDQMFSFFKAKGLSDAQVSGIMGNAFTESKFDPGAIGDSGHALGLFQWNDRADAMKAAVPDWATNPQGQMQFAWDEMQGPESKSYNNLLAAQDPTAATKAFMGFERPRGYGTPGGVPSYGERSTAAQGYYDQYSGTQGNNYGMGSWDQSSGGATGDWGMNSYMGTGISGDSGGMDAINQLTESTNALKAAQDSATTAATSMTSGVTQATQAATQLGTNALPATTTAMQNMASTGVQQATTGMLATGTASVTSAASIQTLGSAALSSAAQMGIAGKAGLFHAGGMAGSPISGFRSIDLGGFSGPRLAKGLLPGEFRAVLHRNEAVFNDDQLKALGGALSRRNRGDEDDGESTGGGSPQFHFHGVKDFDSFKRSESQMTAWAARTMRKSDLRGN